MDDILVKKSTEEMPSSLRSKNVLFNMDASTLLDALPNEPLFDLVVTSPPYNIGKEYEHQMPLNDYIEWQENQVLNCSFFMGLFNGPICNR